MIKGSGLGGTSLVNANVAIIPDTEVFEESSWPRTITRDVLMPYYLRARQVLAANPHPHAMDLAKVQAMERRAVEIGLTCLPAQHRGEFQISMGRTPMGSSRSLAQTVATALRAAMWVRRTPFI